MSNYHLPEKTFIASFDIDAQKTFTPLCPDELPVAEGDKIVPELNAQAEFAALRVASRDAHSLTQSGSPRRSIRALCLLKGILIWICTGRSTLS